MTPDEFEFWQKAYLAALTGFSSQDDMTSSSADIWAGEACNLALNAYRTAKATVVQTTYATRD